MKFYYGVVENRQDPLTLGRCQVRIASVHTHDKSLLPTEDLPWSTPVSPITSGAMNGIGHSPVGPVEGTVVLVMFADGERMQQPIMFGSIGGISSPPLPIDDDAQGAVGATEVPPDQLRTIAGPTTGTQLTFHDPIERRQDLTSGLSADMGVVGYNIPKGTVIVSIDSSTQITISNPVTEYGENLISFTAAPTNIQAILQSREYEQTLPPAEQTTQTLSPSNNQTNSQIPIIPPRGSVSNSDKASEGIRALLAACDKVGLSTKEQKCALLGIIGGESGWVPKEEAYNYSESRLQQVFSFATAADVERYARAPRKNVSRYEFFSWVYGPQTRGRGFLGNLTADDGGKFYGRGFIQLTGRSNYERYNELIKPYGGKDIMQDPDALNNDLETSALVAAVYLKDRVARSVNPNSHPTYFYAAKRSVGYNTADIAARKLRYYEYFYGGSAAEGGRTADVEVPTPPAEGESTFDGTPQFSQVALERGAINNGFRDPNSKYPQEKFMNEPDTNRLSRGIIDGTVVPLKDATRIVDLPKGVVGGTWEQPEVPYGAQYPFNHVYESESGHIMEFDDTPGQERTHSYHRSGTYTEVDANGTQVNYIVGDNFILMERNGNVHVAGECNITIEGQTNIFVQSDANIEVAQNANIEVGNNMDINVHRDIDMTAGGDMRVNVAGDYSLTAANIFNYTAGEMKSQADSGMHQQSGDLMYISSTSGLQLHDATQVNIESSGTMDLLSGGVFNADYSSGHFGEGATGAGIADTIGNGLETLSRKDNDGNDDWTFTPVDEGQPINAAFPPLLAPERKFDELTRHETPEEWDTPEGRYQSNDITLTSGQQPPTSTIPPAETAARTLSGGSDNHIEVSDENIRNTETFTNDFRLSEHFTLGMLIDGGVNGRHRLVDQQLSDGNTSRIYTKQEIVANLAALAQNVLEPALAVLPGGIDGYRTQWQINSGYRLRGVVGNESARSQHPKGQAVDIGIYASDRDEKYRKHFEAVQAMESLVPYDQLILEYRGRNSNWIHVSYNGTASRRMAFTMKDDSTYRRNAQGYPEGFYLLS
jgi:predicted chitinase